MPTIDRAAPSGSGRLGWGLFELGTRKAVAMRPIVAMGTLMRNTEPHQKWTKRKPPNIGPIATPSPAVPDQIPIARARSRSAVNTLVRIDNVQGIRAAAPTPMTARAAVRRSGVPDQAARADPTPKTTSPPMNTHLRPTRSPNAPNVRSRPAKKTAKASTIHWSWVEVACRLRTIDGRATLRIVLSRLMSNNVTQRTANVARRRPRDMPVLWTIRPPRRVDARKARSVGDHQDARAADPCDRSLRDSAGGFTAEPSYARTSHDSSGP